MDCQAQAGGEPRAGQEKPAPVVHEGPAPLGAGRTVEIDLAAVEESAAGRLEDLRRKPLWMRLMLPEFWMGTWGTLATLQLLLALKFDWMPRPALVDQSFLPMGLLFLVMGWNQLAFGLVMLRLRRHGVLQDLHLAGEHPLVVFAAVHHRLSTRFDWWSSMIVAPMLLAGFLDPARRMFMTGMLLVCGAAATVHLLILRRRPDKRKSTRFSSLDAWVLVCESDATAPALWNYSKAHGVSLLAGVAYLAGSFYMPAGLAVLAAVPVAHFAGRGFRNRLGSLDAERVGKLHAAWCLGESPAAVFRELTGNT